MPGRGVVLSADPGSFWMPTGGSLRMPRGGHYQCRFTEADYQNILRWTAEHFGTQQERRYAQILESAIEELTEGPEAPGAEPLLIDVLRVLHDRMDRR